MCFVDTPTYLCYLTGESIASEQGSMDLKWYSTILFKYSSLQNHYSMIQVCRPSITHFVTHGPKGRAPLKQVWETIFKNHGIKIQASFFLVNDTSQRNNQREDKHQLITYLNFELLDFFFKLKLSFFQSNIIFIGFDVLKLSFHIDYYCVCVCFFLTWN